MVAQPNPPIGQKTRPEAPYERASAERLFALRTRRPGSWRLIALPRGLPPPRLELLLRRREKLPGPRPARIRQGTGLLPLAPRPRPQPLGLLRLLPALRRWPRPRPGRGRFRKSVVPIAARPRYKPRPQRLANCLRQGSIVSQHELRPPAMGRLQKPARPIRPIGRQMPAAAQGRRSSLTRVRCQGRAPGTAFGGTAQCRGDLHPAHCRRLDRDPWPRRLRVAPLHRQTVPRCA
jgi:hypothetical protein